ncbi:hypothetical protein D3C84_1213220 [compost metagenome]
MQVVEDEQAVHAAGLVREFGDPDKLEYVFAEQWNADLVVEPHHPPPVARHDDAAFAEDGGCDVVEHVSVCFGHSGFS